MVVVRIREESGVDEVCCERVGRCERYGAARERGRYGESDGDEPARAEPCMVRYDQFDVWSEFIDGGVGVGVPGRGVGRDAEPEDLVEAACNHRPRPRRLPLLECHSLGFEIISKAETFGGRPESLWYRAPSVEWELNRTAISVKREISVHCMFGPKKPRRAVL